MKVKVKYLLSLSFIQSNWIIVIVTVNYRRWIHNIPKPFRYLFFILDSGGAGSHDEPPKIPSRFCRAAGRSVFSPLFTVYRRCLLFKKKCQSDLFKRTNNTAHSLYQCLVLVNSFRASSGQTLVGGWTMVTLGQLHWVPTFEPLDFI